MNLALLRKFIKEQIQSPGGGVARNVFTYAGSINSWDHDYGYDVDISPNVNGAYSLTIYYEKKKIIPITMFNDYDEAELHARKVVDKHRIKTQNNK